MVRDLIIVSVMSVVCQIFFPVGHFIAKNYGGLPDDYSLNSILDLKKISVTPNLSLIFYG